MPLEYTVKEERSLPAYGCCLPKFQPIESLHLPQVLERLMEKRQGLILLTGPTGCGKTSTMTAFVDLINARRRDHIITIEYQHTSRKSIIEQIEVGHDTPSFALAVRILM